MYIYYLHNLIFHFRATSSLVKFEILPKTSLMLHTENDETMHIYDRNSPTRRKCLNIFSIAPVPCPNFSIDAPQEFPNKSEMQRHAKEIHGLEEKSHKCPKCFKSFPSSQQLAQHSLVHTNIRKYKCKYCDKAFKQLSHIQQHTRTHTGTFPPPIASALKNNKIGNRLSLDAWHPA